MRRFLLILFALSVFGGLFASFGCGKKDETQQIPAEQARVMTQAGNKRSGGPPMPGP